MNFTLKKGLIEIGNIQISYIWDNRGDSKYLVLIDNKNKIKYCPDTYSSNFVNQDVIRLIYKYAELFLGIEDPCEISFSYKKMNINRVCHADDFLSYKKHYKTVWCDDCRKIGLKY